MMTLIKKKSLVVMLSILCAICLAIVGVSTAKANAQTGLTPVTLEATTMNDTAEIRQIAPTGIRFTTKIAESDLAKFANTDDIKVVTMITPQRYLTEAGLTFEEFKINCGVRYKEIVVANSELPDAVDNVITVKSVLLEVQDHNIAEPFVARTYITDGESIGYAEARAKSIYEVASNYLEIGVGDEDEEVKAVLTRYSAGTVVNAEDVDSVIASATKGKVIKLDKAVQYGTISISATAESLLIDGKGATVEGITFVEGETVAKNVTIKDVNFTTTGINATANGVNGLIIKDCTFTATASILADEQTKNVVVDGCKFENVANGNSLTAIKITKVDGLTVKNSEFINVEYNAMQLGNLSIEGKIVISGNTFNKIGDRVFRVTGTSVNGATVVIENNTFNKLNVNLTRGYINNDGDATVTFGANVWYCIADTDALASGILGATITASKQTVYACDYNDGVCTTCGTVCAHDSWTNDVCDTCGIACVHEKYTDGKCAACGKVCAHTSWNEGVCATCGTACSHNWTDGVCGTCTIECAHENYTNGVCDVCEIECSHSWVDGVCVTCNTACVHESYKDGECVVCGKQEVARAYDIADLGSAYTATYNEDGSITISGNELNWIEYKQVLNGEFKANTTYKVTVTALDIAVTDTPGWIRIMPDFNEFVVNKEDPTNYLCTWITSYEMEYTVGDTDIDSIIIYTLYRYGNSHASSTPFAITLKATVREVVPYEVVAGDTVCDDMYITNNNDGSYTIGANAFSGRSQFKQIFNGEFKANTTYNITISILSTTGTVWGFRLATQLDTYGTGNAIYVGKESITLEYTVGETDIDQIVMYSITRFTANGQDTTHADAWSVTFNATIKDPNIVEEVVPYEVVAGDTVCDDMYITNNNDGSYTIGADAFSGRSQFKQIFNGEFKANTTYVITLTGSNFTGDYAHALRIYSDASSYKTSNTLMDNASYNPKTIEITIGDADVNSIVLYSTTRYQSGQTDGTGTTPWSITLSATIAEKVA